MKKNSAGFTLIEILCSVLVVVLLTGMIVTGITFGAKNYGKNLSISEARTLYCTLATVVTDELRYSTGVTAGAGGTVSGMFSQSFGRIDSGVFESDSSGRVYLGENRLLSNSAYTRGAKASVTVIYDPETRIFTADIVISSSKGDEIYGHDFQVRQINAN